MTNELLWIALMLVSFIGVTLAYKFFGKVGLYVWMAMSVILANIQVLKTVELFGFVTALGNIIYSSTYLATDILNENHGEKEAKKGVWVGFFILLATTVIMQISLQFIPHVSDTLSPSLEMIFGLLPRIAFASLAAYLISQYHDVWAFQFWKKKFKGKYLWLRNNLSTMTSQLVDNIVFTYIAFIGLFGLFGWQQVLDWSIVIEIFVISFFLKWIVAIADTPFLYLSKRLKNE